MSFKDELNEVIRKKALGFSYTEETVESETTKPKPFVLCEGKNRLYTKKGYIMVQKIYKNGEICGLKHKNVKSFSSSNKILNFLKLFKLKGF